MTEEKKQFALEMAIRALPGVAASVIVAAASEFEAYLGGSASAAAVGAAATGAASEEAQASDKKSRSGKRKPADKKKPAEDEGEVDDFLGDLAETGDEGEGDEAETDKTLEDVRAALRAAAVRVGSPDGQKKAVALLQKYAKTLEQLKPADFDKVIEEAAKLK